MTLPTNRSALWVVLAVLAIGAGVVRAQEKPVDITGTWKLSVETQATKGTPTVTFKQEKEKLTGLYTSESIGKADVTGTIKGKEFSFTVYGLNKAGRRTMIEFNGTVTNQAAVAGKVKVTPGFPGTFSGTRE